MKTQVHSSSEPDSGLQRVGSKQQILIEYQISSAGQVLEGTEPGQPVSYQMGQGQWPMQLELAMFNEPVGSEININITAAEQVFGIADPDRIISIPLNDFPQRPEVGALLEFSLPNSSLAEGQVLKILEDQVEVDFNHPYAGRDLSVKIKLVSTVLPGQEQSGISETI